MHAASSYSLEARHADVVAVAVKSLTGQILRKLATEAIRGRSLILQTHYYKVTVSTEIPGVPKDFVYANAKKIFDKVFQEVEGFGFFKYRRKFVSETTIEVRLYFTDDIVFKYSCH